MTPQDCAFLQSLHKAGVILTVDGNRLLHREPAGVLTDAMKATVKELSANILYEYHERAAIIEYDGRLPRGEAEARATSVLTTGA